MRSGWPNQTILLTMAFRLFVGILMLPFSLLYGCAAAMRRFLYRKGILRSGISPVASIDVGNLAVGGTGKTPHTQYIVGLLKPEFHVAVLSRGYGRKSKGYQSVTQVDKEKLNAETFGDESYMTHLRHPDVPLAVDSDRCEGVRNLLSEHPGTDVLVLDDAYQHLRFQPSFHILLTEYDRPYRPDLPIPAGMLREFPRAARFADMVIVTKVPDKARAEESAWRHKLHLKPQQQLFFTRFRYKDPVPVTPAAQKTDFQTLRDSVILTGIAHPKPLIKHLGQKFNIVKHFELPDHHVFTENEIRAIYDQYFDKIGGQCILFTTEKDWMRLQSERIINIVSLLPVFVVPVEIDFLSETQRDTFNQILQDHVRGKKKENSGNSCVLERP